MSGMLVFAGPSGASAQTCAAGPVTLQILGSGGPAINSDRASTSYLLWIDGKARMLVDMGGGAYLRFGQSGAKLSDLALIAISHLHPDHVSDLPALLWLSHQVRKEPLPIVGPSAGTGISGPAGNDVAPDFPTFLARMFDEKNGAFQVMGATLGASKGNGVPLKISVADVLKSVRASRSRHSEYPTRTCRPWRTASKLVMELSSLVLTKTAPIRSLSILPETRMS
jgi:ribonuclease BN (tRNA processing enzyme)